ncbi:2'-5' RNA ligase family protein [Fulvimarina sp. 2208YS6-2-32]|uniref:2'-5' RNA ligase family protein n=1 Tax=Fulvimarina uroteuthidis TaxID=3098149 RepID=A0ABU5I3C4_9HYPH|nr:2'-5' RNA ligase family protein [Fulvimarina sp. 2208YS6-2-32]MDY8109852.1 2'-5' RNA ligase family protein [Fulvimarina sp. 2208YS6-2-32]
MSDDAPLILTVKFDDPGFERFQRMRKAHFPAAKNYIPAHLTLFHHLPGDRIDAVIAHLVEVASRQRPIPCRVSGLRFLGKGIAYEVDCHELERLRADLAGHFYDALTAQDRQRIKPHVTIQNKADPVAARTLYDVLESDFEPFPFEVTGLLLWRYRGGPWDPAGEFSFAHGRSDGQTRAGRREDAQSDGDESRDPA